MKLEADLVQGSKEWHTYRAWPRRNASEAAQAMGVSKTGTRNDLLKEKHTGYKAEASDFVQKKVFDVGHAVEALARPIAENIIDDMLCPLTFSDGDYSVSVDGITLDYEINFEHKQWNDELGESIRNNILPDYHKPQVQQSLMITGAKKCLFMVSNGTEEKCAWMWVYPDPDYWKDITNAWDQFAIDLSNYTYKEPVKKSLPSVIVNLPSVTYSVEGLAVISNIPDYRKVVADLIATSNTKPETDLDYVNLETIIKEFSVGEKRLPVLLDQILSKFSSVKEITDMFNETIDMMSKFRRSAEKIVKEGKENVKNKIVIAARNAYSIHITEVNKEISPIKIPVNYPDFAGAMKSKRTIDSLNNAVDTLSAAARIDANNLAVKIKEKLDWFNSVAADNNLPGFEILSNESLQDAIFKPIDDFQLLVNSLVSSINEKEAKPDPEIIEPEITNAVIAEKSEAFLSVEARCNDTAEARKAMNESGGTEYKTASGLVFKRDHNGTVLLREREPDLDDSGNPARPSDISITGTICIKYGVTTNVAIEWLKEWKAP